MASKRRTKQFVDVNSWKGLCDGGLILGFDNGGDFGTNGFCVGSNWRRSLFKELLMLCGGIGGKLLRVMGIDMVVVIS